MEATFIALMPLNCSRRNLQFPQRVPKTRPRRKNLGALALPETEQTGLKLYEYFVSVRPGDSFLRGQDNYQFAEDTSIGKSISGWELFEGAPKAKT